MKRNTILTVALCASICSSTHLLGQTFHNDWIHSIGSIDKDAGIAIDTDDSHVYVFGNYKDFIDLDPGKDEVYGVGAGIQSSFLQKLDVDGNLIWAKALQPHQGYINAKDLHINSDGSILLLGEMAGKVDFDLGPGTDIHEYNYKSAFLVKYNTDGELLWSQVFPGDPLGGDVEATRVIEDYNQDILFACNFIYENGLTNTVLTKLDGSGSALWSKSEFGYIHNRINDVAVYPDNSLVITGNVESSYPSGNGVTMSAFLTIYSSTGTELEHIVMFNSDVQTISTPGSSRGLFLEVDDNYNIYWTGKFSGTVDLDPLPNNENVHTKTYGLFTMKLYPSFGPEWTRIIYADNAVSPEELMLSPTGKVVLIGRFSGLTDFTSGSGIPIVKTPNGTDAFIQTWQDDGSFSEISFLGGLADQSINDITKSNNGEIYVTGSFEHIPYVLNDQDTVITSRGDHDAFTARLNTSLNIKEKKIVSGNVYPNPTRNTLFLETNMTHFDAFILDVSGKEIERFHLKNSFAQLDVSNYAEGVYFLHAFDEKNEFVKRFVKH